MHSLNVFLFNHVYSIILLESMVKSRENGLAVQGIELCWLEGMDGSPVMSPLEQLVLGWRCSGEAWPAARWL